MPNERQKKILEANGINPDAVAVMQDRGDSMILQVYRTRDTVWIHEGGKPWEKEKEHGAKTE